jgi:hypothetical protein
MGWRGAMIAFEFLSLRCLIQSGPLPNFKLRHSRDSGRALAKLPRGTVYTAFWADRKSGDVLNWRRSGRLPLQRKNEAAES